MTKSMIEELVEAFAIAAGRCRTAGLDGVEVHGGHGYLVAQFLSPVTNRREDEYGGSLLNRTRFVREVLAAIRSEVGDAFPVGLRISATEDIAGGVEPDEAAEAARVIETANLIDFLDISVGSYYPSALGTAADMHAPHGYQLPMSSIVASAVKVPTIVIGRIMNLAEAEKIVAEGTADMVSMVRATIADPDLVVKSFAGKASSVIPCIGCNQGCIASPMGCTVNPQVGREAEQVSHGSVTITKKVMVIGAGPAGMEAARAAALRGHHVTVHEATDRPGGLTQVARRAPYRDEIGAYCDWQAAELERLEVEIRYGSQVDSELVRREAPHTVIVATGSLPRRDGIQRLRPLTRVTGIDLPHVVTPLEVLSGNAPVPQRAVVVDDLGTAPALGVAEYLLTRGAEVAFATCERAVGASAGSVQGTALGRMSRSKCFSQHVRVVLEEIGLDRVYLRNLDSDEAIEIESDQVVVFTGFRPQRSIYDELTAAGVSAFLVGDAQVPLNLDYAISSGSQIGAFV
jgi:NADPH-dependent 2,4-dienoyl-CoA reductase/sulfur reductase-like enzyme